MAKAMTKYQLDHFEGKVRRQFDPLIEDQELLVKQYTTQATNKAVAKLSKKMGADKIIANFRRAEHMLKQAQSDAKTFFQKKAYSLIYKLYVWSYTKANGYSPYSLEAMDEHDRYTDNQEYTARMSIDGGNYA